MTRILCATQVGQPQKCIRRTFSLALRSSGTSFRIIGQKFILVWRALSNCYTLLPNLHLIFSFFCLHSWPHKWTKNSRNNSPPEKSWKSSHRPENGNVWIMLLGLFRDSSRYTLRKFTITIFIWSFLYSRNDPQLGNSSDNPVILLYVIICGGPISFDWGPTFPSKSICYIT